MKKITFLNIVSGLYIENELNYENFKIIPSHSLPSVLVNKKNYKPIQSIELYIDEKKFKKDLDFFNKKYLLYENLYSIAKSELSKFLYKLSTAFSVKIFLNYPFYFEFHNTLYKKEYGCPTKKLNIEYDAIEKWSDYIISTSVEKVTGDLKILTKIKSKNLNLCYLYYSTRNESLDISMRLLSAWKYFEEIKALNNISCKEREIPDQIFNQYAKKKNIDHIITRGYNEQTKKYSVHIKRYKVDFLKKFYTNTRLVIAHHQRDADKFHRGKQYIPEKNIREDILMKKNLNKIIDLMNQINKDYFKIFNNELILDVEDQKITNIKYLNRL